MSITYINRKTVKTISCENKKKLGDIIAMLQALKYEILEVR